MVAPLHVVAPSRWVADQAARSSLFDGYPTTVIPNGLDVTWWSPGDGSAVRRALDIPQDARVVLFVAEDTENRFKGFAYLADALRLLVARAVPGLFLLSAGHNDPARLTGAILPPERRLHLGALSCDRLLRMAYRAADVFVMPSVQESFGQTVVEAMACGIPVVAFGTGGMLDTVRPGVTGRLVPPGDAAGLADAIERLLLGPATRGSLADNARRIAADEYSSSPQAPCFRRENGRAAETAGATSAARVTTVTPLPPDESIGLTRATSAARSACRREGPPVGRRCTSPPMTGVRCTSTGTRC